MATKRKVVKQPVKKLNPILAAFTKRIETNIPKPLPKLNEKYVFEQPFKSLLALSTGVGTQNDWHTVAFRIFAGIELAKHFTNEEELIEVLDTGLDQMDALNTFYSIHGTFYLLKEELDILNTCLILVETMHLECSDISIAAIYRTVEERIRAM